MCGDQQRVKKACRSVPSQWHHSGDATKQQREERERERLERKRERKRERTKKKGGGGLRTAEHVSNMCGDPKER